MPLKKRTKRILQILGLVAVLAVVILLALPVWLPWVLKPVGGKLNLRFQSYDRMGYGKFALNQVSFTSKDVAIKAERVEALTPYNWLWQLRSGPQRDLATVTNWQLTVLPKSRTSPDGSTQPPGGTRRGTNSVHKIARDVLTYSRHLSRWLPRAVLSNGAIQIEDAYRIELPEVTWAGRKLQGRVKLPHFEEPGRFVADFTAPEPREVSAWFPALDLSASNRVSLSSEGLEARGVVRWHTNSATVRANFGQRGLLPETGSVEAPNLEFPATLFGVPQLESVKGNLGARWALGTFTLDLQAVADPVATAPELPQLNLQLHARGDTNSAVIETVHLTSRVLEARLSRDLQVFFRSPYLREPAALAVAADLERQRWLPLTGTVKGQTLFWPGASAYPRAQFSLEGANVGPTNLQAEVLSVAGDFEWPWLRITNASASLKNSEAQLQGELNLDELTVGNGRLSFAGPLAGRWLPEGYGYEDLQLKAAFRGPLTNLLHNGHAEVKQISAPGLLPVDLAAEWAGEHVSEARAQLEMVFPQATISTDASVRRGGSDVGVQFHFLELSTNRQPLLSLRQPASVELNFATNVTAMITPFVLAGTAGVCEASGGVTWPRAGQFSLTGTNLDSELGRYFLKSEPPPVSLQWLALTAAWSNGPVTFDLSLAGGTVISNLAISAETTLAGGREGLAISNLAVFGHSLSFAQASGFLPITFHPGEPKRPVQYHSDQPVRLNLSAEPESRLLREVARQTGIQLRDPRLKMDVQGTWRAPRGRLQLGVEEIQALRAGTNVPAITDFDLSVDLDENTLRVRQAELFVKGQRVALTGQVPLGEKYWKGFPTRPVPDWEQASARVLVQEADIEPFAELAPQLITPQGELTIDASLNPGFELSGKILLQGARTRPLPEIGPIRNINLQVDLATRLLQLTNSAVEIGGVPVQLAGRLDVPPTNWFRTEVPPFEVRVTGTNVPLSRQPESIIRSDLDLMVTKTNGQPPIVHGTARLQNSHFLSDLADLVPGKVASPERRPPYFSINDPVLGPWRLGVQVTGTEFLRVRSPLFAGTVSANLKMQGTLKDPIALGDVTIDSGRVRFPFGSLEVQQGLVSLTSVNPYQPQLSAKASSRQFGYDIQMEVTGPASEPVIQFNSSPPLSSEQILLMLTAGEMPQGEQHFSTRRRAQSLALFLGRDLLARLGIGDSNEPRLMVRSGEDLSDAGRPTYDVEYRLTDRWSVTGEYDRFGDFNVGAKWRIYSR